jgi:hypothetical protein
MKRFISISMIVVAGWLMLPALAASSFFCSMQYCHHAIKHTHCAGMIPGNHNSRPAIGNTLKTCQGGCILKGRRGQAGLPSPVTSSAILHPHALKKTLRSLEGGEPNLLTHSGRAPPFCTDRA